MLQIIRTSLGFVAIALMLTACEEPAFQSANPPISPTMPGNVPQPNLPNFLVTVSKKEYIPPYELFAYMKCVSRRYKWVDNINSYSANKIPGVIAFDPGGIYSFEYLNDAVPGKTENCVISLFYQNKLRSANIMWDELTYTFGYGLSMEEVKFAKPNIQLSLSQIMYWVKERPSLFKSYWPGSGQDQISYQAGDFILFKMPDADLYGGIRIESMSPRIIEVYLALPNP